MKNKHFVYVALAAAALATSCASEDIAEPQKQNQNQGETRTVTLTASVNEGQTRVGMTKNGTTANFYWQKDDKILVQTKNGDTYSGAEFTATVNTDDATTAQFTGEITEGSEVAGYAVYPYSETQKHSFTGEKALTYSLPAEYNGYVPATQIFGNSSSSTNMPMVGAISNNSIEFKHLGGLAVIRVDKMPASSGTLTVTADQQLSGDFTVSDLSASEAQIATTTASGDNGKVVFDFSGASTDNVGVFYLPLATGTYSNVTVVLQSGDVNQTKNWSTLTISRAQVTAIPVFVNTVIDGHEFVDLGLSVLWAETNIGATKAADYGNYYVWAGTETQNAYNDASCAKYYSAGENSWEFSYSKYNSSDYKTVLESEDDAAYVNWSTSCRMPTQSEFEELCNNSTLTWTTQNNSDGSAINGYKVTSTKNGNSIFLPAAGERQFEGCDYDQGAKGYYRSSTLPSSYNETYVGTLEFENGSFSMNSYSYRYEGYSIRPVAAKTQTWEEW